MQPPAKLSGVACIRKERNGSLGRLLKTMTETKAHTHSLVKWKVQGTGMQQEMWYRCADPTCYFTAPRSLIQGKESLCPQCREHTLILDPQALKRAKPLCINCRGTKEAKQYKKGMTMVKDLLNAADRGELINDTTTALENPTDE